MKKEFKEYEIDAKDKPLGRVASQTASYLRGKALASFKPNAVPDVRVKISNYSQIKLTGNKWDQKTYKKYSGYPGSLKLASFEAAFKKDPRKMIRRAVEKMLPKNRLRKLVLHNLLFVD